jgi:YegS/Rv2252/BmrU family lipid kinase
VSAGDWLVVLNPAAGGGRGARRWRRLRAATPQLEGVPVVETGRGEEGRVALVKALERSSARRVLVVGGDGTVHLAVNALLELPADRRPAFGLVPAGTGSDLARGLGLPRRPTAALRRALGASPRPLDVLAIETDDGRSRYVVNIASMGLSGAVVPAVNAQERRGALSYLATTLRELLRYQPLHCRVLVDGEPLHEGPIFLVAIANGRFFGKGMKVAPMAHTHDGQLDVVLIPPVPRWQLPFRMPQFLVGVHVHTRLVTTRRGESVRIEVDEDFLPFDLDGEIFPAACATLRVIPAALEVLL